MATKRLLSKGRAMTIKKLLSKGRAKGTGKKRIEIRKIEKNSKKYVAFSKRRFGLYRKADSYCSLTGFRYAVIIFSPTGKKSSYGIPSFNEVLDNYSTFIKENKLVSSLEAIQLDGHNDMEALVTLKEQLQEIRQKAERKIGEINTVN